MRSITALTATILALTLQIAHAQQSPDEAAVRAVIARETAGWDKFDPKQVASVFTPDAVWQNPFGVRLHGRAEIEKFLTGLMARPGYRAAKDTSPTRILIYASPHPPQPPSGATKAAKARSTTTVATPCSRATPTTSKSSSRKTAHGRSPMPLSWTSSI